MIILGIEEGHNGTVCVMKDGKVIYAMSKERISRKKNDNGYPKEVVDLCLKKLNLNQNQIDQVVLSSIDLNILWMKLKKMSHFKVEDYVKEQYEYFKPLLIDKQEDPNKLAWDYTKKVEERKKIKEENYDYSSLTPDNFWKVETSQEIRIKTIVNHLNISPDKISFVDHHHCHGYYAYYSSYFRGDVLILTADAFGDGLNATISICKDNKIKRVFQTNNCQIARIYRYITLLLGMKPSEHEYKVMGLAPYSNITEIDRAYNVFSEILKVNDLEFEWVNKPKDLYFHFRDKLEGCRFDGIAGALQKYVEELFTKWVRNAITKTGIKRVVFSGGLAMNIKLNMAIANMSEVESFYVSASPGDESNAIGACYYFMDQYCEANGINKEIIQPLENVNLGEEFTKEEVLDALNMKGIKNKYDLLEGVNNKYIAKKLVEGNVIGICRGRMEFGARALGNRSILADPSNPNIVKKINDQIKFRDFWMPFTPSILFERCSDYLVNPKNIYSPFMTVGFDSTSLAQKEIIASLHPADLTARPQMLKEEVNPEYYNLIKEFENLTGIGAVLNTSLNLHGLPIVCSPKDAIEVMENSKLDMIYFGDLLITRRTSG
jgi:carbamoyltransferase